jgi:hypothetical protein
VKKRSTDWGAAEFGQRLVSAWHGFRAQATAGDRPWLTVQAHTGAEAATAAYGQVLGGQGDARVGQMLSLSRPG